MKKLLKNKYVLAGMALILVAGIGTGIYFYQKDQKKKEDAKKTAEQGKSNETASGANNNASTNNTTNTKGDAGAGSTSSTPTTNTSVGELKEVSLTVYLMTENTTSQDGKTAIQAGSLQPYFYLPAGTYTVQKMVGANWVDVATNIAYSGHGGLGASFTAPSEDNINYRVLNIVGGKQTAVSKTFVVKRSDLTTGVHTYN